MDAEIKVILYGRKNRTRFITLESLLLMLHFGKTDDEHVRNLILKYPERQIKAALIKLKGEGLR